MAGVRTIGPKRAYDRIRLREMGAALSADRRQSQPAISKRGGSRLNGARPERRTTLEGAGPERRRARTAQAVRAQGPNYARPELRKTRTTQDPKGRGAGPERRETPMDAVRAAHRVRRCCRLGPAPFGPCVVWAVRSLGPASFGPCAPTALRSLGPA